jgi:hypothetical protein
VRAHKGLWAAGAMISRASPDFYRLLILLVAYSPLAVSMNTDWAPPVTQPTLLLEMVGPDADTIIKDVEIIKQREHIPISDKRTKLAILHQKHVLKTT